MIENCIFQTGAGFLDRGGGGHLLRICGSIMNCDRPARKLPHRSTTSCSLNHVAGRGVADLDILEPRLDLIPELGGSITDWSSRISTSWSPRQHALVHIESLPSHSIPAEGSGSLRLNSFAQSCAQVRI
jgi:hypothetical protein